jgi:hypothetical protein
MHFEAIFPTSRIANSSLIYRANEYSFDVVPVPNGFTSVLVNDLNLEVDEHGRVVSVWGVCPYPAWNDTALSPPGAEFGDAIFVPDTPLQRGVSLRLNEERTWPVLADKSSGWVHIDGGCRNAKAIRILTGVILEIDKSGNLCGIWLRPSE